jgi:hypothetical protein
MTTISHFFKAISLAGDLPALDRMTISLAGMTIAKDMMLPARFLEAISKD